MIRYITSFSWLPTIPELSDMMEQRLPMPAPGNEKELHQLILRNFVRFVGNPPQPNSRHFGSPFDYTSLKAAYMLPYDPEEKLRFDHAGERITWDTVIEVIDLSMNIDFWNQWEEDNSSLKDLYGRYDEYVAMYNRWLGALKLQALLHQCTVRVHMPENNEQLEQILQQLIK